ncbi:aminotransferase-like domain-containing protein [Lichenifustis flavocetrariae]|uniref:PLP-dependent aminotransferase family protein n=1 Tax=Lichenifustis flavocetrariae TaxID=2949735 RepID=A0AA42CM67_9HYPH|nr:PLP-dependent aminotransferase family protein [Lichenifustis flavocetrariae]MCW6508087.1 PLP-dependent aminotransferase family protein [Lichenifustis flavocetrariae]
MSAIRDRIAARALAPGARLPSVRKLAETMDVSKSTVVEAYERLCAEGAIVSRRGSGFFVAGATRPLSLKAIGPQIDRVIDPIWLTLQSFQAPADMLKPGSGWLPDAWMPDVGIQRAFRQMAREPTALRISYDRPLGFAPLRQYLARRLGERGIVAEPDQIILVDSSTQAVDLLLRFLIEPGTTVLVDDPCYYNFHALLRAHRANVVGVPFTPHGPDLDAFATALKTHRPRLYLTNSALHNPTGASLSAATVHRVLKLCEAHDTIIIEDDIFADFESTPTPRLAGFDGLDRVILTGGFSKTISAAMRCSFIAVKGDWIEPLIDLKLATSLGNNHVAAAFVHNVLTDGGYRRHLDSVRAKLSNAMGETVRRLRALGLTPLCEPQGGMFLWAELPDGLDSAAIARHGLQNNVLFAPGNVFSQAQNARSFLRFNVARSLEPQVCHVLEAGMKSQSQ